MQNCGIFQQIEGIVSLFKKDKQNNPCQNVNNINPRPFSIRILILIDYINYFPFILVDLKVQSKYTHCLSFTFLRTAR